jgi:hypothetical protein
MMRLFPEGGNNCISLSARAALTCLLSAILAVGTCGESSEAEPLYPIYKDGKWGLIDQTGGIVLAPRYDQIAGWIPETWDAANPPGQVLVLMTLEKGRPIRDKVIPVRLAGKSALATRYGKLIELDDYDLAGGFSGGLLRVKIEGKSGFLNESGDLVIPAVWDDASPMRDGYAFVKKDERWGVIDRHGDVVVEPSWEEMPFRHTELAKVRIGSKWGVVDRAGNTIVPVRFDDIYPTPMGPLLPVIDEGRTLYVHLDGEGTVAFEFRCPKARHQSKSRALGFFNHRAAIVNCGDKYGLIDESGKFILEPEWDNIKNFDTGRSVVERRGKQGLIDESGHFIVEPQKDLRLYCCFEGTVGYWRNGAEGFLDLDGNEILSIDADSVGWVSEGLIVARRHNKDGYVDLQGRWVIAPRFHDASPFNGPLAVVRQPISSKLMEIGYINKQGEVVYKTTLGGFLHYGTVIDPRGLEASAE